MSVKLRRVLRDPLSVEAYAYLSNIFLHCAKLVKTSDVIRVFGDSENEYVTHKNVKTHSMLLVREIAFRIAIINILTDEQGKEV